MKERATRSLDTYGQACTLLRVAPKKLAEWWRVAYCPEGRYNHNVRGRTRGPGNVITTHPHQPWGKYEEATRYKRVASLLAGLMWVSSCPP